MSGPAVARCPHCAEPVAAADRFCEACGGDLQHPDGRYAPDDHVELDLTALAGVTDRGLVHVRNEDALALGRPAAGSDAALAVVVCDGVSSSPRPEQASRAAADAALAVLLQPTAAARPDPAEERMTMAVAAAATAVAALATDGTGDAPACTLVAALVERPGPDRPAEVTVAWVGDSRAYWLAAPDAPEPGRRLTEDHSWAAELVAAGTLTEAASMTFPGAHAITRWLGAGGRPTPQVCVLRPAGPGVLVLCTDGLWNYLPAVDELAAVTLPLLAGGAGALAVAVELTRLALAAGGHDNITVVVVPVDGPAAGPDRPAPRTPS